jgi:NAD(P)-dependent dehydrogenase (short-subunit alcohol dehydrogenase family)
MPERQPRLEGKVAIVTGAGSSGPGIGTGKAISVLFAREGARVLLVDRVAKHAEETLAAIREEGGDASVYEADVTNPADCQGMVETVRSRYGRLDILVNNIGIRGPGAVVEVKAEDWDRVLDVNLKSMMLTSKYAIPEMIKGGGGAIVNLSSIAGLRAGSGGVNLPYARVQGGCHCADHGDGGAPWPGPHRGERHRPRSPLHADGGRGHDRGDAGPAATGGSPRHRGDRLGHRLGGGVPGLRRDAVDHRRGAAGGRSALIDDAPGVAASPAVKDYGYALLALWI